MDSLGCTVLMMTMRKTVASFHFVDLAKRRFITTV